jgi:predicted dehydrogenase
VAGAVSGDSASPVRIGILGAAKVAAYALIAPARETGVAEAFAVAARDRSRALAYAEVHGIPNVADDYDALIADPRIDAIYNALPPALHAQWTIRALKAGKHVLCEKPFCVSAGEARAMVAAAEEAGLQLVEAFHYRHHPLFARVLDIVRSGALGRIERVSMHFEVPIPETPTELRYRPELGGGALFDLGTYCLHMCRSIAGEEPVVRSAEMTLSAGGVDIRTHALLDFPSGITGEILCDMQTGPKVELRVEGSQGTLTVNNPLAPQYGHLLDLDGKHETVSGEATFNHQLRAFAAAVRGGPVPVTSGADSIAQIEAIDAVRRAARTQ